MYHHRRLNDNRVNEKDVPESQHTIFIRGLPGSTSTTIVKEFFEEHIGACSFDFIKVSQDRAKLFIAVRFESKSAARDALDKYGKDGEILGHNVQLSYFRDIRRYITHVQKQGGRSLNHRTERRRPLPSRRSRSRSRSLSHSRSRSRSSLESRSLSRTQSSRHSSDRSANVGDQLKELRKDEPTETVSPVLTKKLKKIKKEKKKKRKHQLSPSSSNIDNHPPSDMDSGSEVDGGMEPKKIGPCTPMQHLNGNLVDSPQVTLISPSPPMSVQNVPTEEKPKEETNYEQNGVQKKPAENGLKGTFLPIGVELKEELLPFKEPRIVGLEGPASLSNFSTIQHRILQDIKHRLNEEDEEHQCPGNFRLSSLSTQKSSSSLREEKLKKLSSDMRDQVDKKKQRLEQSYRADCETFGLMTRKFIAKDRGLENRLRLALLEVMKDLELEAQRALDEYVDQLIFLST